MAPELVYVVGAPRSGTTFLQNLLGAHPAVVTTQENDLFDRWLASWRSLWAEQVPDDTERWARRRYKGLGAVLVEEELDEVLAGLVERVYGATAALKPDARVIADKVPQNVFHAELILRYRPGARFLHVIRDGRDVVVSLLRASRGWGRDWAPSDAVEAARRWQRHVEAGRALTRLTAPYAEVRYEDLCGDRGPAALREAYSFCGVEASLEECERTLAEFALVPGTAPRSSLVWGGEVARRGIVPAEPDGFSGEGGVGAWRGALGRKERLAVERYAGDLLRELGYADDGWADVSRLGRALAYTGLALDRAELRARSRLREALRT